MTALIPPEAVVEAASSASTNDDIFELLTHREAALVWTTRQTAGRGSRGRSWLLPPDHGLAMTLGWHGARTAPADRLCYPLLAGLAVYRALDLGRGDLALKWPNDLLLDGRKVAGILCESRWQGNTPRIAVGIGINLKRHPSMDELPKGAAALSERGETPAAGEVVERVRNAFQRVLEQYPDTRALTADWLERSVWPPGTHLRLMAEGAVHEGRLKGLDTEGNLLLQGRHALIRVRQSCTDFEVLKGP